MILPEGIGRRPLVLLSCLTVTGIYLYTFPTGSLLFVGVVLLHVLGGLIAFVWLIHFLLSRWAGCRAVAKTGWILLAGGGAVGLALVFTGTARPYLPWMWAHAGISLVALALLVLSWRSSRVQSSTSRLALRWVGVLLAAATLAVVGTRVRLDWHQRFEITNPPLPPATMDDEGDGRGGPFFPSSAQTSTEGYVPVDFFMESQKCERCHEDIYEQWSSSAHRFSSFNNQWYRKSIEYMQQAAGVEPSKWCGGCHDPAVLFTGLMDRPVGEIINREESHVGLGCVMCHSVSVKSTMGQGDYTIEYPPLYQLATSENPVARAIHDFVVRVNPEPHRRAFLKPFMRDQAAEFCSTCHKVHLDLPVNSYRWIRGFNDYDNWQASGVSGLGSRSFYYPDSSQTCTDCHMPRVASQDLGNRDGLIHSHRFPAANTALPTANQDSVQMETIEQFLTNDIVTLDIFAVSPARPVESSFTAPTSGGFSTTFAVGEEADLAVPVGVLEDAAPVTAPIDRVEPVVRRGDSVRVDLVVRTRKVGHFFPAGTVDAFDVWTELVATDSNGKTLFWSGRVEDGGRGPVEKGAHFYRSLLIDAHGNPIDKRNAYAARAVVYVNLIPPGAADTVHYRLEIPDDAGDEIRIEARLHYRKFTWFNTNFAYAGVREGGPESLTPDYDDGIWRLDGDTSQVSGALKQIPDLPIITLAEDTVTLQVADSDAEVPEPQVEVDAADWERWNDYGIGLLRQGDLRGAEIAFQRATEADPDRVDGWVNIGRVRVAEGNLEDAREVLEHALAMDPDLARTNFFYARVLREAGEFEAAIEHLNVVTAQYPRDRVVWNEVGLVRFLERRFEDAVPAFERVLQIDPEDLMAHYNLMRSYSGLGDEDRALEHQQLYLRFKADESAQAITGPYRRDHPDDNRERQPIHEHESIDLTEVEGGA